MPSNDERRQVAARLRDYDNLYPIFEDSSPVCAFWEALDRTHASWKGVCDHLADLIEPERTCHNLEKDRYARFVCSNCGSVFDSREIYRFIFCPACRATVVEHDDK